MFRQVFIIEPFGDASSSHRGSTSSWKVTFTDISSYFQNKIAQLKHELELAEAEKLEKEAARNAAEEPESLALEKYREAEDAKKEAEEMSAKEKNEAEAREVFEGLDSDSDGTVSVDELKRDTTYDTNRDGEVSDDEAGVSRCVNKLAIE